MQIHEPDWYLQFPTDLYYFQRKEVKKIFLIIFNVQKQMGIA